MADIYARQRQLIGSPADWSADDIIIGKGEFALEVSAGVIKMKVGDGVKLYSALPYVVTGSGGTATPLGTYLPLDCTTATAPGFRTLDGGFYLKGTLNPLGHPTNNSVLEFTQTKTANGDEFGFSVQKNGNAGFDFVSRDAGNNSHWLRWTRNGMLVLSNTGNSNNAAIQVVDWANGELAMTFQHTDEYGVALDSSTTTFYFAGAAGEYFKTRGGVASQTGTPSAPTHLITMGFADANYEPKGSVSGFLPILTNKLDPGASTIDGGFYLKDSTNPGGFPTANSVLEFTQTKTLNGDEFGFAVQEGKAGSIGNAGFTFVSRDGGSDQSKNSHWLRWTRSGRLVLSNIGSDDNAAMYVTNFSPGELAMVFEHTDATGASLNSSKTTFYFAGASSEYFKIRGAVASQTGTPSADSHLLTRIYADTRYQAKGTAVTGSYLPLTGGILKGGLQIKDNGIGGGIYLNPDNVQARAHMQMENVGGFGIQEEFGMAIQTGGSAGFRFTSRDVNNESHSMQFTRKGMFVLSNNTNNDYMGIQVTGIGSVNLMTFQHTSADGSPTDASNSFVFQGSGGSNVVLTNGVAQQTGTPSANVHLMTRGASDARYARASDKELKKGIKQGVGDALAALTKLNPVAFQYRAGTDCKIHETHSDHFGFIAQEVSEVIPELVYENEAKHLGLDYLELVPLLVKAVQQLNDKLEAK